MRPDIFRFTEKYHIKSIQFIRKQCTELSQNVFVGFHFLGDMITNETTLQKRPIDTENYIIISHRTVVNHEQTHAI